MATNEAKGREDTPGTFENFCKRHSERRKVVVKRAGAPLVDYFDQLIADHEWGYR